MKNVLTSTSIIMDLPFFFFSVSFSFMYFEAAIWWLEIDHFYILHLSIFNLQKYFLFSFFP